MSFFKLLRSNWIADLILWLILFTPLIYAPSMMFPATFSKGLWFFALNILFLAVSLFVIKKDSWQKVFRHPLTWMLALVLVVATLATILGVNPFVSFWGPDGRLGGLITLINAFVLFILVAAQITHRGAMRVLGTMVVVGSIVTLYTIAQALNLPLTAMLGANDRLTATFGNPLFLGSFLVLIIPFSLYFFLASKGAFKKMGYLIALLLQVGVLLATMSRGPILGFLAGLGIFILGYLIIKFGRHYKKFWATLILWLIILGIFAGGAYLLRGSLGIERIFRNPLESGSTQARLVIYESVFESIKERPLLGYGPENVYVAYDRHHNSKLDEGGYKESFTARAHNLFLDQGASTGLVGVVALIMLITVALFTIIRWLRKSDSGPQKILALSFLAAGVGYLVQDLTLFETVTSYMYGAILFALLVGLSAGQSIAPEHAINRPRAWQYILTSLAIIVGIFGIFRVYYPAYANSTNVIQAVLAQEMGEYSIAGKHFQQINEQPSPWDHFFLRGSYAGFVLEHALDINRNGDKDNAILLLQEGTNIVDNLLTREPLNIQIRLFRASLNTALDFVTASNDLMGDQLFEQLIDDNPNRVNLLVSWGRVLFMINRDSEAIAKLTQAINVKVVSGEANFWFAIVNHFTSGNRTMTHKHLRQTADQGILNSSDRTTLEFAVSFLVEESDFKTAVFYEDLLYMMYPDDSKYIIGLAVLYESIGQLEKASQLAEQALRGFPTLTGEELEVVQSMIR